MKQSSLCAFCRFRHFRKPTCDAYPDGIPRSFFYGHEVHLKPTEGDHGIQFEIDPKLPATVQQNIARIVREES